MFAYIFVIIRYINFLGRHGNRSQTKYILSDIPQQVPISKNSTTAPLKLSKCKKTSQQQFLQFYSILQTENVVLYLSTFVRSLSLSNIHLASKFFLLLLRLSLLKVPHFMKRQQKKKNTQNKSSIAATANYVFVERSTLCLYRPK